MRDTCHVEYVLEPVDAYGDILDPQHYPTFAAAYEDRMNVLAAHPAAVYVALAVCTVWGNPDKGITDRVYQYRHQTDRDGRLYPTDESGTRYIAS